ncbi:phosphoglycerate dehydrogenase-like oxidoreductase [Marinitoga piezophila KA3]|uniref:Phosphoglycerate dehydrogenase-like oxidoreductase n=1 Tax=Marinitoga piezophila (strain DSM 14283 / JCM 11233 / KA3) TaxID=443254 RepID=H2J2M7_MARPK|nr:MULTISPECIES: 2-hydroxyacid dehydrogenase [Marinitoga]AEX84471.1 phosphoglycerate dehydrogenase-like oxidoreductase [Marinitoga piezophila KA3]NUU96655.1 2-hydroxyacid dehydrogenase [Marinitoga sp. 1138]
MKILFLHQFNSYWDEKLKELKKEFPEIEIIFPQKNKEISLKNAEAIIGGFINETELEIAEKLKIIFVPFAGVEQLPLEILKEKNIIVSNAHGNGKYVAERAVALALALLGKVIPFHEDLKNGVWHGFTVGESIFESWHSIQGMKIGILGFGEIGKNIARFLKPFDTEIHILKNKKIDYIPENVDKVYYDVDEIIEQSEMLFLTLPLTEKTFNILSKERIMKMKDKYIINIGRGKLIDEEGLYLSLKEGILKGVALDVWFNYPTKENKNVYPSKYPIWEFDNVVLSPHVGGYSFHATTAGIDYTIESIKSYLKTGKPLSIVDYEHKY